MNNEQTALLELVRMGATGECLFTQALYDADWKRLFELACKQGVACVAWHGIEILYEHEVNCCPLEVKLQWYARHEQVKQVVQAKVGIATEFAKQMQPQKMVVLKGFDYGRFWPDRCWREFCDLDCYVIDGNLEDVDKRAEAIGCKVDYEDYKHIHIYYRDIMVENHHFFTAFGGSRQGKVQEVELRKLFSKGGYAEIGGTGLYSPNREFTAVFMLAHAQNHFFYEGIVLRHILDWHFFLQKEGGNVDWQVIKPVLEKTGLMPFAVLLTQICSTYLGLHFEPFASDTANKEDFVTKFLVYMFDGKYDRNGNKVRRMLHRYCRFWQFRRLNKMSVATAVWRTMAFSSYMHRYPELNS